jgi:hypothetical protein
MIDIKNCPKRKEEDAELCSDRRNSQELGGREGER